MRIRSKVLKIDTHAHQKPQTFLAFVQIRPILLANILLGTDSACTNSLIILADTPMKNTTEPDPVMYVKCKQLCLLGITAVCCQAMTVNYIW